MLLAAHFQLSTLNFTLNEVFRHRFRFTQADVVKFAEVSGDDNPLHLDAEFAAQTIFKRPIIHGFLGGSVFSKIIGTQFPGYGSIYLKQTMEFLRPMFVDTDYEAVFTITAINPERHTADLTTEITDVETGKITTRGEATVMNREKF